MLIIWCLLCSVVWKRLRKASKQQRIEGVHILDSWRCETLIILYGSILHLVVLCFTLLSREGAFCVLLLKTWSCFLFLMKASLHGGSAWWSVTVNSWSMLFFSLVSSAVLFRTGTECFYPVQNQCLDLSGGFHKSAVCTDEGQDFPPRPLLPCFTQSALLYSI